MVNMKRWAAATSLGIAAAGLLAQTTLSRTVPEIMAPQTTSSKTTGSGTTATRTTAMTPITSPPKSQQPIAAFSSKGRVTTIEPSALYQILLKNPQVPVFDFARKEDFVAGHVSGSRHASLESLLAGDRSFLPPRNVPTYFT